MERTEKRNMIITKGTRDTMEIFVIGLGAITACAIAYLMW